VKLSELAARLECDLEGDGDIDIRRVATLEQAGSGDVTFLANAKYASQLPQTRASAVIAGPGVSGAPCAVLRAKNPYLAFALATQALYPAKRPEPGVHPTAIVAADAVLGNDVTIGPYVVIESGVRIGARTIVHAHAVIGEGAFVGTDCLIHPRVSIRERVIIGAGVIVQDGAVIGSEGFGFATSADGRHAQSPQVATVVIEDDVEIGANTTIDRPAVGETRVHAGTKIDNLVQIAHGVVIGKNSLLAAQVGIAGSSVIGESVMLGGQVGVTGHVTIGDRAKAAAKTGIIGNVPPDAFVTGYPEMDNLEWRKSFVVFRRLPEMRKQLADLVDRMERIEKIKGLKDEKINPSV
jgi:UDP-3-O-[3-hydroxymyristoyl] glucosamine N-acyltransferase